MILGFKPQFVEPILQGTKIHSIRADQHDQWRPGITIQMATGMRTKNYQVFDEKKVVSVQPITIRRFPITPISEANGIIVNHQIAIFNRVYDGKNFKDVVSIDHGTSNPLKCSTFKWVAINDGLLTDDFLDWFLPGNNLFKQFSGKIIHWTDLKY